MKKLLEKIIHNEVMIALILRSDYHKEGIEFFTPGNFSQQLAYMNRPVGHKISPHVHNKVRREVLFTQEVLFIKKGKVKVDFFNDAQKYLESVILNTGDVILLSSGGHGFEMLEQTEIIEVKQGPYSGDADKIRFEAG